MSAYILSYTSPIGVSSFRIIQIECGQAGQQFCKIFFIELLPNIATCNIFPRLFEPPMFCVYKSFAHSETCTKYTQKVFFASLLNQTNFLLWGGSQKTKMLFNHIFARRSPKWNKKICRIVLTLATQDSVLAYSFSYLYLISHKWKKFLTWIKIVNVLLKTEHKNLANFCSCNCQIEFLVVQNLLQFRCKRDLGWSSVIW